jgi:Tol biopolymer transport system component/tRNA A-37 threonylcarbamoyl transferase component Bud32
MIGKMLRHYRVDVKIGEGGMGVVYKGWDTHLDRPVAIKVLSAKSVADPERKRRFVLEAKSASALNHAHIVTVYDVDNVDGIDFIAMEYVEGETLDHRIGAHGMRLNLVLKYAVQMADALVRAHGAGIIHRDLKPANVMVDKHDQLKILDFGLAKLTDTVPVGEFENTVTARHTERGTIVGTPWYMSPEQAEGKLVDARSDIFSFGSMLYEMVTGSRPFQASTKMAAIAAILSTEPAPASTKTPGLPHEMERIISRCRRKDPDRRFQQMAEVKLALEDLKEESESGAASQAAYVPPKRRIPVWAVAGAALVLIAAGAWFWSRARTPKTAAPAEMTRLTFDSGWTTDPALSSDGKLLAYASDRATGENLDIWLQHLGGGNPVRLTNWDSDEMEPNFSPDGSRIAFRSTRGGGGVYVVPVLGGEPVQVASKGFNPRFSPDGNSIAYWVGSEGGTPGVSRRQIFIVPANGGAPRQIAADLNGASYPVWSPDGKKLILDGWKSATASAAGATRTGDWWLVPIDGGPALATGMATVLARHKLIPLLTNPAAWTPAGDWILYSAGVGDTTNLYRVRLGGYGKISQDPERITFGTSSATKPAISATGQLALAGETFASHLWSLPMNTNLGKPTGEMTQLTKEATVDTTPRISEDGKTLVYFSESAFDRKLFVRHTAGGAPRQLAPAWRFGQWTNILGSKIIFQGLSKDERGVYQGVYELDLDRGTPALLLRDAVFWHAASDGRYLIVYPPNSLFSFGAFDIQSGKQTPIASDPAMQVLSPQFSPDTRWVAIHARNAELTRQIFVLPFHPDRETPHSEWIPITDGKQLDRDPKWSVDGKLLYFLADRDGARGIYAQRVDPATGHPLGAAFEVKMFRSTRRSMMYFGNTGQSSPAIARDRIVFALGEMTGNIWLTKAPL